MNNNGDRMNSESIRTFIAIELDQIIKQRIAAISGELSSKIPCRLRWVKPDLIHLTLAFLGNIPGNNVVVLKGLLDDITKHLHPFNLEFRGMGCFPNTKRPRVVWIGSEYCEQLNTVHESLTQALRKNGFDIDTRPFSPHLTLARVPESTPQPLLSQLGQVIEEYSAIQIGLLTVTEIKLIKSDLLPSGPRYTTLSASKFSGQAV